MNRAAETPAPGPGSEPAGRGIIHVPRRFVAEEWGGTETVILEISRRQQQEGWRPRIMTSLALSTRRREEIGGVPVRRFPYCYPYFGLSAEDRLAMDKKGGNLVSLPLLWALLREPDVRIFHAHALKRLGGVVRTAARLRKKPYAVTLHGGYFDVPAAELESMARSARGKPEWGKPIGALLGSRRVLEDADAVICVGQSEFEQARSKVGHDRVWFQPNGVDPAKFDRGDGAAFRARHGIAPDGLLLLCLSRIDPQKNQRLLVEAFAEFSRPRPEARLALIGPHTDPAYAESLKTYISQNGLSEKIRMLPGLRNDDPELVNAFHACDIFVLPSIHEPFGIVVLEAWCCGKPVVASRIGGLKSLVREGETGLFFDPAAGPAALRARLETLAEDPGLRARIGRKGREEVLDRHTWRSVASELENIYRRAEEHAGRRARKTGS